MARRARRRARQQARYDRGGGLGRRGIMPRIFPGKNYRYEEEEREEERMPPVIREARPGEGRGGPALIYEIPFEPEPEPEIRPEEVRPWSGLPEPQHVNPNKFFDAPPDFGSALQGAQNLFEGFDIRNFWSTPEERAAAEPTRSPRGVIEDVDDGRIASRPDGSPIFPEDVGQPRTRRGPGQRGHGGRYVPKGSPEAAPRTSPGRAPGARKSAKEMRQPLEPTPPEKKTGNIVTEDGRHVWVAPEGTGGNKPPRGVPPHRRKVSDQEAAIRSAEAESGGRKWTEEDYYVTPARPGRITRDEQGRMVVPESWSEGVPEVAPAPDFMADARSASEAERTPGTPEYEARIDRLMAQQQQHDESLERYKAFKYEQDTDIAGPGSERWAQRLREGREDYRQGVPGTEKFRDVEFINERNPITGERDESGESYDKVNEQLAAMQPEGGWFGGPTEPPAQHQPALVETISASSPDQAVHIEETRIVEQPQPQPRPGRRRIFRRRR